MYDLIWSKPMTEVAKSFGVSNVAVKKACIKHGVPAPPRGYWARKRAGEHVRQVKFDARRRADEIILIRGQPELPVEVRAVLEQERERRKARKGEPMEPQKGPVMGHVVDLHPMIAPTARALRKGKPDTQGVIHAFGTSLCGVEVAVPCVERVILTLDALARCLEKYGLGLMPTGSAMTVSVGQDVIEIHLREFVERRKHVPTADELATERALDAARKLQVERWAKGDGPLSISRERAYPKFDEVRTGHLSIAIVDQYVSKLRRTWHDGKVQRLEHLADEITSGIVAYLAGVKAKRLENESWHRERERCRRLEQRAKARAEREENRREFLGRLVNAVNEVNSIRSFLDMVRSEEAAAPDDEIARMAAWAKDRLTSLEKQICLGEISRALREDGLFPQPDDLECDPLDAKDDHVEQSSGAAAPLSGP
jgi:hypothetical protein